MVIALVSRCLPAPAEIPNISGILGAKHGSVLLYAGGHDDPSNAEVDSSGPAMAWTENDQNQSTMATMATNWLSIG